MSVILCKAQRTVALHIVPPLVGETARQTEERYKNGKAVPLIIECQREAGHAGPHAAYGVGVWV